MLRVPDIRTDDIRLVVALDVKLLLWFDLLLFANHTHIHHGHWHKGKSLKHGSYSCAAAVLLLC